jgi:hypothetical protein
MHHIGLQEELPVAGFKQLEEEQQQDVAAQEVQHPRRTSRSCLRARTTARARLSEASLEAYLSYSLQIN